VLVTIKELQHFHFLDGQDTQQKYQSSRDTIHNIVNHVYI